MKKSGIFKKFIQEVLVKNFQQFEIIENFINNRKLKKKLIIEKVMRK